MCVLRLKEISEWGMKILLYLQVISRDALGFMMCISRPVSRMFPLVVNEKDMGGSGAVGGGDTGLSSSDLQANVH